MLSPYFNDMLTGLGLLLLLLVGFEGGFRAGRRAAVERDQSAVGQVGAIQGAVLGVLGLLLAFTFSAAAARFIERQDQIVTEANAIGTAFLRADLIDDPYASNLRAALEQYTKRRIEVSKTIASGLDPAAAAEFEELHRRMWAAASAGVRARPEASTVVVPAVNDVIDMHSTRVAAGRKHIPTLVLFLLIAASVVSIADIGYGCGMSGPRRVPLTVSLAVLLVMFLWITIDLDHPRSGFLQLSDAPLKSIRFDSAPR